MTGSEFLASDGGGGGAVITRNSVSFRLAWPPDQYSLSALFHCIAITLLSVLPALQFPLSVPFQQCSTLFFNYMFLLPEGQTGEAWEPSKKQRCFVNRRAACRNAGFERADWHRRHCTYMSDVRSSKHEDLVLGGSTLAIKDIYRHTAKLQSELYPKPSDAVTGPKTDVRLPTSQPYPDSQVRYSGRIHNAALDRSAGPALRH